MKKLIFAFLIMFMIGSSSIADIPKTLNYQGRLMDQNCQPVTDGQYSVTFRLYTAASGGNMVWEEAQNVAASNGYFNTVLGNTSALSSTMFDQPLWAGIQVGTNAEMTPRQKLSASAYAMNVADGAITNEKLASGAVTADKVAGINSVPKGAIILWRGASCPVGYQRVGEFDGKFPRGAATYGGTGGSETHTHTMQNAGDHTHSYSTTSANAEYGDWGYLTMGGTSTFSGPAHTHSVAGTTGSNGNHAHTVDAGNNLPPYIDVIFCEKE